MPIKKPQTPVEKKPNQCPGCGDDMGKKILMILIGVLLLYVIAYLGVITANGLKQYSYIGQADKSERVITVSAQGKVTALNDIAVINLGYSNVGETIAEAQKQNTEVMDAVIADLKNLDIVGDDLQSDYNVYPEYEYTSEEGRKLLGYRITHQLQVKIRDISKVQDVLALVGKHEINQVSGLSFTIDDDAKLKDQAREQAIAQAKEKAIAIAKDLGVKLTAVASYNEYEDGNDYYYKSYAMAEGMGGAVPSPDISTGSREVSLTVNVSYIISR